MRIVGPEEIARVLDDPSLIEAIAAAFRGGIEAPARHHHAVPRPDADATLLLMPAWNRGGDSGDGASGGFLGCKVVTVFPGNAGRGHPSVHGSYLLMSGETGEPLAVLDGAELTARRTAAASALAARHLARIDAAHLVMVGAGTLAPHLVRAHAAVRPVSRVTLWNRTPARAEGLAARLRMAMPDAAIAVAENLESAVREADIVSCATLSAEPLVRGAWLKAGAHLDLVGGFTAAMREADDEAVRRASLYVDTRASGFSEAGDIVDPIRRGVIAIADIRGDLSELCRGTVPGRGGEAEITLFKSVGAAIEDLAAAALAWERIGGKVGL